MLENSLAPSASSTGGKAVFEAIHTKGHGINGITVLRDEGLAFGQVWCEVASVAGAFRGEYQRLLLMDRTATVSDIARDHGELGAEGHLDMRVLRHSHVYKVFDMRALPGSNASTRPLYGYLPVHGDGQAAWAVATSHATVRYRIPGGNYILVC